MAYTNSSLVNYTKLSPHKNDSKNPSITSRKHPTYNPSGKITKITIHHMAGNLSVETCGNVFQRNEASANYGIGSDGRVGLYVNEKDRSWASSSYANDFVAVTIEVANNSGAPNWTVSDTAYNKLIDLCVDICKRNGIKKLNYTGDASGNLTMHCYFAPTACPGPYLKKRFAEIASTVNARLGSGSSSSETTKPTETEDSSVTVDGQWGVDTTSYTQRYFGTTVDGIVSNQLSNCKQYLPNAHSGSWRFVNKSTSSGSPMIKKLQKLVSVTQDGLAGKDTVKALQKYLQARKLYSGDIDGIMGSGTVKGWQNFINNPSKYEKVTVSGSTKPSTSTSNSFKVGDVVQFAGGSHYASAGSSKASSTNLKAGPAKITAISEGSKHPYHIVHTDSTTAVYGWVNKSTISKKDSGSTSTTTAKKVVDEDGIWGVSTTKYTQKLMGTTQDGIVSNQRKAAKKYIPAAHAGSWQFNKILGGGSPMIKKLQAYIGMTSKECDGLFGVGSIKQFQTFLKNKGYYTGSVDGVMGTGTAKAWQKYLNTQFA